MIRSYNLEMFDKILTGLNYFFHFLSPFYEQVLYLPFLTVMDIQQLRFEKMTYPKISEFFFIILVGISVFCVALLMFRLFSSLKISCFGTFLRVFVFPGPRPSAWPPALAPNLYLPALALNLYLPALVPNFYLPALAPNFYLLVLACPEPELAYANLVPQFVFTGPGLRFVLPVRALNLH